MKASIAQAPTVFKPVMMLKASAAGASRSAEPVSKVAILTVGVMEEPQWSAVSWRLQEPWEVYRGR